MALLQKRLAVFQSLSETESSALQLLGKARQSADKGKVLLAAGQSADRTILVHSGWAMIYRDLADGRRQIMQFCLPGDLVDPCSLLTQQRDFSIAAVSTVNFSYVSYDDLTEVISQQPQLAIPLLWAEAREVYLLRRHLMSVGRMTALERIAALLLEFAERLSTVGQFSSDSFELLADQQMLGDATGLSAIHISRTMKALERRQLLERSGRFRVKVDKVGLRALVPDMLEIGPRAH